MINMIMTNVKTHAISSDCDDCVSDTDESNVACDWKRAMVQIAFPVLEHA